VSPGGSGRQQSQVTVQAIDAVVEIAPPSPARVQTESLPARRNPRGTRSTAAPEMGTSATVKHDGSYWVVVLVEAAEAEAAVTRAHRTADRSQRRMLTPHSDRAA
jgi:hypothetical protein